jgi:putative FmdB family regulatory protein
MPIFEYLCQECNHRFELIVQGKTVPARPACQATTVDKQFSTFGVGATGGWPVTSGSGGACGSCGDPRGPGSCSTN